MSTAESKDSKSNASLAFVPLLVLAVYILFPHVFLLPVVLINGDRSKPPPEWMSPALDVVFWPIRYGVQHVPPYAWLIQKESELTGIR